MQTPAIVIRMSAQFAYNEARGRPLSTSQVFLIFVNKRRKKKVPQTYKGTELSNHY